MRELVKSFWGGALQGLCGIEIVGNRLCAGSFRDTPGCFLGEGLVESVGGQRKGKGLV